MINKVNVSYTDQLAHCDLARHLKDLITINSVFVCIGTDRIIVDCLGPLVGTMLKEKFLPLPVYGTIEEPIHALNIKQSLKEIYKYHSDESIIGIDSCVGKFDDIGYIKIIDEPICPGSSFKKDLPIVGKHSIIGITGNSQVAQEFINSAVRLNVVYGMAKVITLAILEGYQLYKISRKAKH